MDILSFATKLRHKNIIFLQKDISVKKSYEFVWPGAEELRYTTYINTQVLT